MKKLLLTCLLFTGWSQAQNITFTDPEFKKHILEFSYWDNNNYVKLDKNNDSEISIEEAKSLTYLDINDSNVVSIEGIENFINLASLRIYYCKKVSKVDLTSLQNLESFSLNQSLGLNASIIFPINIKNVDLANIPLQVSLDFTQSKNLKSVLISDVNVSDLDFTKCLELESVAISNFKGIPNNLDSLDFTSNTKLNYLQLSNLDKLKMLDISNLTSLKFVSLPYCKNLTTLNLSNTTKLWYLNILDTKITTLDLSKSIELEDLGLNNEIKSLDLSNNFKLDSIATGTSLEYLNIKKGSHLSHITLAKPSTHLYICADDQNIPLIEQSLDSSNYLKIQANSYCTFTPGGVYNNILAKAKFNLSGNCSDVNGLSIYPLNTKFNIDDLKGVSYSITDKAGKVEFYKQIGSYTLTPQLENSNYFQISPSSVNFKLIENSGHDTTINFCITPNGNHKDLEVVLAPFGPARPGFDATYLVTYKNKGNQTLSGDVSVQYNEDVLDFVRSTMSTHTSGLVSTSFTDLKPFEVRVDTLVLNVNSPVETPAVNINDTLKFIASINPTNEDETPKDNVFNLNQRVVGAYDPNLITCLEGNELKPTEIGKTLHYTIEFENTGNYPAENIVVVEEIDPKKYDINSIQILNTSHPMKFRVEGNKVEYYFEKIQLGEHKHGNILLKLNSNNELNEGSEVDKQANIYFDYNAPVQTNKEKTTYKDLKASIADLKQDVSINVYPNPGNGLVNVNAAKNIKSIEVYDVNGRVIQTKIANATQIELHLSDEITGIYFIKVITQEGANVIKYQKN